uniref:Uncharacterized protein n=1 Tax=Avena sativa TaxID=4498 RepID=A0ACD5X2J8_AVESA
MSLRRYVNLVTANGQHGIYSLRRLNSEKFFFPADEAAAKARDLPRLRRVPPHDLTSWIAQKKKKQQAADLSGQQLESITPSPRPIFKVRPTKCPMTNGDRPRLHSFPLSGTKIFFADSGKRTTLYDTEALCAITTPCLHERKNFPVALSVPNPETEGEQDSGSLYIMDTTLNPRNTTPFEALICRGRAAEHFTVQKTWHCDALPRPPFFDHRVDKHSSVLSYAVVGNFICVSLTSGGTYCFDMVSRTWNLAGDWQMPFDGKAEYIPELKLWFGASADNHQLPCAADLSPILGGHAPKKQQHHIWGYPHLRGDWFPDLYNPANLISLGSGRFCIINYFRDMERIPPWTNELSVTDGSPVIVFSGLEVLACNGKGSSSGSDKEENCSGKGNVKESSSDSNKENCSHNGNGNGLRMIKHKSLLCKDTDKHSVESVL